MVPIFYLAILIISPLLTPFYWATHSPTFTFSPPVPNKESYHRLLREFDNQKDGKFTNFDCHIDQFLRALAFTSSDDFIDSALLCVENVNEPTLVHDIGCWNGENLVNFILMSAIKGKNIAGAIGTDINFSAIEIANSLAEEIELNSNLIQFHQFRAHDHFPYHLTNIDHNNILITA